LRAWLAGRSTHELEQTFTRRPDVLWGAPIRDLDDLADRLVHSVSVAAAVGDLPAPALQALEVLTAAGAGASPERAAEVLDAGASGRDVAAHRQYIERCLLALQETALVWPCEDGRLVVNPGVHEVIAYPLGFGRPVEVLLADVSASELKKVVRLWGLPVAGRKADLVEAVRTYLADASRVRMLVGEAPASVARVLVDRSQEAARRALSGRADSTEEAAGVDGYPSYRRDPAAYSAHRAAVAWASENGLGFSPNTVYSRDVELPSEAVLALVGADFKAPFTPVPPPVAAAPVTEHQVRASASGAITEFLAAAMATLETTARTPLTGLKSGGVGTRELVKVAKRLGAGVSDVRVTLELALWLQLLARDSTGGLGTSPAFDEWRRRDPARRAADLLATWFALDYVPTIDRDDDGRTLPALARLGGSDQARAVRILAFTHLDRLDDGMGVAAVESLAERLAWRLPLLMADGAALDLHASWDEAERLGVVAHGRLSGAGTALFAGDDAGLIDALTGMLPAVQTKALFGSDLTVVVPGSPDPAVVDLLDAVAVREGRGAASTWRVTPESVREALDNGYDAAELVDRLRGLTDGGLTDGGLTDGGLPQALEYLIRDVGRRHGHVQVRPAGAVVQSDDDALLAEIAVHRALRKLGLRRIAPTVIVAAVSAEEVVAGLRAAGYLPLELGVAGDPVVQLRSSPRGADTDGAEGAPGDDSPSEDDGDVLDGDDANEALRQWAADFAAEGRGRGGVLASPEESPAEVAERLTGGVLPAGADGTSALEQEIRASAPRLSSDEARQLAHAIVYGDPVTIRYRSSSGGLTVRVVSGLTLEHGHLIGWCHLRQDERTFTLASIYEVAAAPPS